MAKPEDAELWTLFRTVLANALEVAQTYLREGGTVPARGSGRELRTRADGIQSVERTRKSTKDYADLFGSDEHKADARPLRWSEVLGRTQLVEYVGSVAAYRDRMTRPGLQDDLARSMLAWEVDRLVGSVLHQHLTEKGELSPIDYDLALGSYLLIERWWRRSDLKADLLIPICGLDFSVDCIELSHTKRLRRISDRERLALWPGYDLTETQRRLLSGFTHVLEVDDVAMEQEFNLGIPTYSETFPSAEIERFLEALATVSMHEFAVAYAAFRPKGWSMGLERDIPEIIQGPVLDAWNGRSDHDFSLAELPRIDADECNQLKLRHAGLISAPKELQLAASRLLSSWRREQEVDKIVDICVAFEALAGDAGTSEMTYKIALRITALMAHRGLGVPRNTFTAMKKIYAYRSAVVHGQVNYAKKQLIAVEDLSFRATDIGTFLLGITLGAALEDPALHASIVNDDLIFDMFANYASTAASEPSDSDIAKAEAVEEVEPPGGVS